MHSCNQRSLDSEKIVGMHILNHVNAVRYASEQTKERSVVKTEMSDAKPASPQMIPTSCRLRN